MPTDSFIPGYDTTIQPDNGDSYYRKDPSITKGRAMEEAFELGEQKLEAEDDAFWEDVTDVLEKGHIGFTASMTLFGAGYAAQGYLTGDIIDISEGLFVGIAGAKFLSDAYRAYRKGSLL